MRAEPDDTQSSALSPQSSVLEPPGEWAALLGLLLVGTLVGSVMWAWNNPASEGRYAVKQADKLLAQGRYLHAVALLERTLTTHDSPQGRLGLSYAYLARRDGALAGRQALRAIETAPPGYRSAAWAQMGRVLAFRGRDDQAMTAWEQAVATSINSGGALADAQARSATWHMAMAHWKRGDWLSARQRLESLPAGEDVYARSAALKLAQLTAPTDRDLSLRLLDDIDGTSRDSGHTSERDGVAIPDLRVPGLQEGLSAVELEGAAAALRQSHEQVNTAAKNSADEATIYDLWGGFYLQQGEFGLAKQYLERALALRPGFAGAHARLGATLLQAGDDVGVLRHLQSSTSLDGAQPLPHYLLAQLYMSKAQWDMARAELDLLRKLEPQSVDLHLQWAEYHRLRGEYDDAEREYVEAANLQRAGLAQSQEKETDAILALSRFYTDVRGFGCEKGLPAAQQALAFRPGDGASLDAVGWATFLCRQPEEALAHLERAVQIAPGDPRYRYHLAKVYARLGRAADARDQYTWVRDLDPGGAWEDLALSDMVSLPPEK